MLAKVQAFNAEKNNLPLKAAGAFVGAALGAAIIAVALTLVEGDDEFEFEAEAPAEEE